ncbi:MAG: EscU/YscU/HrcU family type III secretion system export apparatus switch protein [Sandaracinaceae bacterium]|nr:EscU/YscU/HrcU family type III secretion system export apparatus switch protein [Sandaracinaceae bacterium]
MSDVDQDQKTEEATPRKQEQLREKGQVVKSQDVAGAAALVGALAVLAASGSTIAVDVASFAERAFRLHDARRPLEVLGAFGELATRSILPVAGVAALLAVGATLAQTRLFFSLAQAAPKPERLDPIQGLSRLVPGPQVLTELVKSLLKIGVLGVVVWRAVEGNLPRFAVLPGADVERSAGVVRDAISDVLIQGAIGLGLLAALDYFIVWRKFQSESRMARHEVKQEHKEQEGDPLVKGRRRQRARELAKQRAQSSVRGATVIVTNPTHVACALRYEPERDEVPVLVAKGLDDIALRMRAEARTLRIPIVENKPLARALHASTGVGRPIPIELYVAAARIIAHVLSLRDP